MSEILSHDELDKLLRVTPPDTPAGLRNRALLVALFADGREIKDTLDLTAAEAEWEDFAPEYRAEIHAWLDRRNELGLDRFGPLFSSLEGKPLKVSYARGLISRTHSKAAKLPDGPEPEAEPPPPAPPPPPEPEPEPEREPEPPPEPAPEPEPAPLPPPPPPAPEPAAEASAPAQPGRQSTQPRRPAAPPPRPPRGGGLGGRSPLALGAVALGALLLAGGGIAAAVALTRDSGSASSSTTHTTTTRTTPSTSTATTNETTTTHETTTAPTTTESTTTTAPPPPAGSSLVYVPAESYCQLQPHSQLGFWITLQNTGGKDVKNVAIVLSETYSGTNKSNPKITLPVVAAKSARLQTVVSYAVPKGSKVSSCFVKITSPAFPQSGKAIKMEIR